MKGLVLGPPLFALLAWTGGRVVLRRRRAEAQYARSFDVSCDMLAITGFDGRLRRVNPAWECAFGYTADEIEGQPVSIIVHPDDQEQLGLTFARLTEGDGLVEVTMRAVRADGTVRWHEINARGVAGEQLIYSASRDVTDRLRTDRELESLALEHAALRRVAMLVARDAPSREVLAAVAHEARQLLGAGATALYRYDGSRRALLIATDSAPEHAPAPAELSLGGDHTPGMVWRTGRAVRRDGLDQSVDTVAGAPISVGGRLWGVLVAGWTRERAAVPDAAATEARLYAFTELVATAVSNASARAELIASRARIVAAGDEARRRIERNLHDGTQQQLIALGLDLRRLRPLIPEGRQDDLEQVERHLESVLEDIRELSRGLHPGLLSRNGLGASLRSLVRRSPIRTELRLELGDRPPAPVETAVYYIVSEALTNAIKHSRATSITIEVALGEGRLCASVADDGVGGAQPSEGSGLMGSSDRVEALGGRFSLRSRPGEGTTIDVELPLSPPETL